MHGCFTVSLNGVKLKINLSFFLNKETNKTTDSTIICLAFLCLIFCCASQNMPRLTFLLTKHLHLHPLCHPKKQKCINANKRSACDIK